MQRMWTNMYNLLINLNSFDAYYLIRFKEMLHKYQFEYISTLHNQHNMQSRTF